MASAFDTPRHGRDPTASVGLCVLYCAFPVLQWRVGTVVRTSACCARTSNLLRGAFLFYFGIAGLVLCGVSLGRVRDVFSDRDGWVLVLVVAFVGPL